MYGEELDFEVDEVKGKHTRKVYLSKFKDKDWMLSLDNVNQFNVPLEEAVDRGLYRPELNPETIQGKILKKAHEDSATSVSHVLKYQIDDNGHVVMEELLDYSDVFYRAEWYFQMVERIDEYLSQFIYDRYYYPESNIMVKYSRVSEMQDLGHIKEENPDIYDDDDANLENRVHMEMNNSARGVGFCMCLNEDSLDILIDDIEEGILEFDDGDTLGIHPDNRDEIVNNLTSVYSEITSNHS